MEVSGKLHGTTDLSRRKEFTMRTG